MKFAHIGDCHLGGWRLPELRELNLRSFEYAIKRSLEEKVEFILVAGDLFDSAYPPIETLKEAFNIFKKVREANIPVFLIAGSHDYSVSGKTFLDVLEKAGFCKNVGIFDEKDGKIVLRPTVYKNAAIYGYPGKKSGLEVEDVERIALDDAPGLFKILMLHTTLKDAVGNLPVRAVDETKLPQADYIALAHLHIRYEKENRVYSGPIFPNSLPELEELKGGSFYIFDSGRARRHEIVLKEVVPITLEIRDALTATEKILDVLESYDVRDKIVVLRIYGTLDRGKTSDIDFARIEEIAKQRGAFSFLKNTAKLHMQEPEIKIASTSSENIEAEIIEKFKARNESRFNELIAPLMNALKIEKQEGETNVTFESRLISEVDKVMENEI